VKALILAGGLGTRLSEETESKPKPMVDVGGRPILWHILKLLGHQGIDEFVVALGYKGDSVKRYFYETVTLNGSMTLSLATGQIQHHDKEPESWRLHLIDTGLNTNTGGRVRRLRRWLEDGRFLVTYSDGVGDVDVAQLVEFHKRCGKLATLTAVRPPARYGGLFFAGELVREFTEKPQAGEGWINGGFMIFEPEALELFGSDDTSLEAHVLPELARRKQLAAFRHDRFWQCMDTLRDKKLLDALWESDQAPWKVWR
jgi:glucose-1-phosphate cytidylyltransferase